jgi:hypothetical protein
MKKVLLTIEGVAPDQKAFRYAVALCQRIRAELDIFQIINPRYYRDYMKKVRKKTFIARRFVQDSMLAATFAEAGEHDTALDLIAEASKQIKQFLSESEKAGVQCHFSMASGNPEEEVVDYVNDHRNVVLTIYDASDPDAGGTAGISKKKSSLAKIKKNLSVPLVTVHR